jgi:hypothetical protein
MFLTWNNVAVLYRLLHVHAPVTLQDDLPHPRDDRRGTDAERRTDLRHHFHFFNDLPHAYALLNCADTNSNLVCVLQFRVNFRHRVVSEVIQVCACACACVCVCVRLTAVRCGLREAPAFD